MWLARSFKKKNVNVVDNNFKSYLHKLTCWRDLHTGVNKGKGV